MHNKEGDRGNENHFIFSRATAKIDLSGHSVPFLLLHSYGPSQIYNLVALIQSCDQNPLRPQSDDG